MIFNPMRPTWRRWLQLSSGKYSILRSLEYEQLHGLRLSGRTLDVGGGQHNSYYQLFKVDGVIESINISPKIGPTYIGDLNFPLPIATNSYDNVISLNTFEHIRNDTQAIAEAIRVLKPGGHFHFVIPFLYRVHGSPFDYHRHTAAWWIEYLIDCGLSPENIFVEPLVWSPDGTAFSFVEFHRFRRLRKRLAMLRAVVRHLSWIGPQRLPDGRLSQYYVEYALGYYVYGTKG